MKKKPTAKKTTASKRTGKKSLEDMTSEEFSAYYKKQREAYDKRQIEMNEKLAANRARYKAEMKELNKALAAEAKKSKEAHDKILADSTLYSKGVEIAINNFLTGPYTPDEMQEDLHFMFQMAMRDKIAEDTDTRMRLMHAYQSTLWLVNALQSGYENGNPINWMERK